MIHVQLPDGVLVSDTSELFRLRLGPNSHDLRLPPAVVRARSRTHLSSGNKVTRMDRYGWDDYLRKLNGRKYDASIRSDLAIFNPGWPRMSSVYFAGNLLRAVPAEKRGWMRIITMEYEAGPPKDMPLFDQNPIYVMQFTLNAWRENRIILRHPVLYYPVVSQHPVYMPETWLEPFSQDMETQMPS